MYLSVQLCVRLIIVSGSVTLGDELNWIDIRLGQVSMLIHFGEGGVTGHRTKKCTLGGGTPHSTYFLDGGIKSGGEKDILGGGTPYILC